MEDYPRNLTELEARFSSEAPCREYLFRLRWPDGFRCRRCGGAKGWLLRSVLLECGNCGYQMSVTAGTIFQDTRKPLALWFRMMWWVTSQKNGASALGLQRALGLGNYKTAWTWLHKLRRAMVRVGRDRLTGSVEVDETYVGGLEEGVRGRQTETKALVDGFAIRRQRECGYPDAGAFLGPNVSRAQEPSADQRYARYTVKCRAMARYETQCECSDHEPSAARSEARTEVPGGQHGCPLQPHDQITIPSGATQVAVRGTSVRLGEGILPPRCVLKDAFF
jgi:hypothetical protein